MKKMFVLILFGFSLLSGCISNQNPIDEVDLRTQLTEGENAILNVVIANLDGFNNPTSVRIVGGSTFIGDVQISSTNLAGVTMSKCYGIQNGKLFERNVDCVGSFTNNDIMNEILEHYLDENY